MKRVLGLDISSSTIGWATLEIDDKEFKLKDYGYIKPSKKKQHSQIQRLSLTYDEIKKLILEQNPDEIAVEQYASKFSSGRSTARTIIVLSTYNETISLCCFREFEKETYKYAPVTIRSELSKYFDKNIKGKDEAFDFVCKNISNFKTKPNRMGNIKKECYDEADAICVALCHFIKTLDVE